jgi:hypothetical protein
MGLNKDSVPLKHDNYLEMSGRRYRSSKIAAFSTNLAFVLFDCESAPKRRILTMHQERRVTVNGCSKEVCDWEEFKSKYKVINKYSYSYSSSAHTVRIYSIFTCSSELPCYR